MQQQAWEDRLTSVQTEAEVIELANQFLMSVDRFEAIQLPLACKPRKFGSAHEVVGYAFDLLQYRAPEEASVSAVIRKLSTFFAAAAKQLARIAAPARRYTDAELGLASHTRRGEELKGNQ
jgi:hypothetical protein